MHALQDDPDFLDYYRLSHDPFSAGGPGFRFFKPGRREVLEQLIHFSRYSQLVLLVTGPKGSGKTVLRHALAAAAKASALNVVVPASRHNDAGGILQQLTTALGDVPADVMSVLQAIEQQSLAGKDVHILIDDAQLLDASAVQLLQRLAQGNGVARARIFLFAEPSLLPFLDELAGHGQPLDYHLVELEPWDVEQAQEYLQQRLQPAGSGLDIFTDQELDHILGGAAGWPGALNQLSREALIARLSSRTQPAKPAATRPPLPYKHMAALLVLAFALVGLWYWTDSSKDEQTVLSAAPEQELPEQAVRQATSVDLTRQAQPEGERIALALPAQQTVQPQDAPRIREPESATRPQVQPVPTRQPEQQVVVELPKETVTSAVVQAPTVHPKPVLPQPRVQQPRPEPAKPAVARPSAPRVEAAVAERAAAGNQGWYAAQPAGKLTLQVFATSSESRARSFVQSNGGAYRYYRKQHQGKPLYVITHGLYDSRDAAVAAENRLPQELRKNKPWPKSLGSIQQEMR